VIAAVKLAASAKGYGMRHAGNARGQGVTREIAYSLAGFAEWRVDGARHRFRARKPGGRERYFTYPREESVGEVPWTNLATFDALKVS
jgi:hypothetical protein